VARRAGQPHRYPVVSSSARRTRRESVWLWLRHRGQVWLERRPDRGVWAGLWCLPEFSSFDELGAATREWPGRGEPLPVIDHALTHFDWRLHPRRWTLPDEPGATARDWMASREHGRWFPRGAVSALGMPAPLRRLLV
jgi:A/G-specific adenine glycosylase